MLAARLTEDPQTRVLLLEAGPRDTRKEVHIPAAFSKLYKTSVDWNYSTEPEPWLTTGDSIGRAEKCWADRVQ